MDYYNGFKHERDASLRHQAKMIRQGKWPKQPIECAACGRNEGKLGRHREDYHQPFSETDDCIPLCPQCHYWIHQRLNKPDGWNRYRKEIREGWRYTGGKRSKKVFRGTPTRSLLDEINDGKLCPDGRVPGNSKESTPIDREMEATWRSHKAFIARLTDWTANNILIEYPDGTTNRDEKT
jgi:hypothetical protein